MEPKPGLCKCGQAHFGYEGEFLILRRKTKVFLANQEPQPTQNERFTVIPIEPTEREGGDETSATDQHV